MQLRNLYTIVALCFVVNLTAQSNQTCATAIPLMLNTSCQSDTLSESLQNATDVSCPEELGGAIWYTYTASFTGTLRLKTGAKFNDAITVFTGTCGALTEIACTNRDEYGFTGEDFYFPVMTGVNYSLQISRVLRNFGTANDSLCVHIQQVSDMPALPLNDLCENALTLNYGENCISHTNENANTSEVLPSLTERARADIWWQFTANETELILMTQADFSAVTAVYSGDCMTLTEIGVSRGENLILSELTIGESYFVQVSGNFATIEGNVCLEIKNPEILTNEDCNSALAISLDGDCTPFSNVNAGLGDIRPSCEFSPAADIWFSFVAPASEGIQFRTNADFFHSVAIYEGVCIDTAEIFCATNIQSCERYTQLTELSEGETYYLQIISRGTTFGHIEGTGCLEILDMESETNFVPLTLSVSPACLNVIESELNVSASGGIGAYTFSGNEDGDVLSGGTPYIVKVTDEAGCVAVAAGEVNCSTPAPCGMYYYLQKSGETCPGAADGAATISITGAANPLFLWSTGETSASVSVLPAGFNSVTVSDGEGCFFQVNVIISAPEPIMVNIGISNTDTEISADGSIELSVSGGKGPYTYLWDNGASSPNLDNLNAGDYAFTVTDSDGCTYSDIATIIVDPLCPENRLLSLDETEINTKTYAASDFITSSSDISAAASVTYHAGNRITLQTGFKVTEGAYFLGRLEDCNAEAVQIAAQVKLSAVYDNSSGLMHDNLRSQNLLPYAEPYSSLEYDLIGSGNEEVEPTVFTITGDKAIVDWVLVELRDRDNPATVLASRAALLCRDGNITDIDGISPVTFADMPAGDYYFSVKHRNHLGIMTASAVSLNETALSIDFTSPTTPTWGTNAQNIQAGTAMMWSGDTNDDGQVIYQGADSDLLPITIAIYTNSENIDFQASHPMSGYLPSDANLDGTTIYQGANSDLLPVTISVYSNPDNTSFQASFPIFEQLPE